MSQPPPEILEAQRQLDQQRENAPAPSYRERSPVRLAASHGRVLSDEEKEAAGRRLIQSLTRRPSEKVMRQVAREEAELRNRRADHRRARRLKAHRRWLEESGIYIQPEDHEMLIHGRQRETRALRKAQAWLDQLEQPGARRVLVQIGPTGTGKSVSAGYLILQHHGGMVVKSRRLVTLTKCGWGPERAEYERLLKAPFAYVEELSELVKPADEAAAIGAFIDDRTGKPTGIGGNIYEEDQPDGSGFWQRFTARFYSRMHQSMWLSICDGPDLRREER